MDGTKNSGGVFVAQLHLIIKLKTVFGLSKIDKRLTNYLFNEGIPCLFVTYRLTQLLII